MGFRLTLFTCTTHYLYYTVCLLYKGTLLYFITCEIQYYSLCISNMVSEPLLWHFLRSLVSLWCYSKFTVVIAVAAATVAIHRWISDVSQLSSLVLDQQPLPLRSLTQQKTIALLSSPWILPRLCFGRYHCDHSPPICLTVETWPSSEPSRARMHRPKIL